MQKLFLEQFVSIVLVALYAQYAWQEQGFEFKDFWVGFGNQTSSVLTIFGLILIPWMLIQSFWILTGSRREKLLCDKEYSELWKVYHEETDTKTKIKTLYTFFFLFRRFIMDLILVFFTEHVYFQIMIMLLCTFLNVGYLIKKPFKCQ